MDDDRMTARQQDEESARLRRLRNEARDRLTGKAPMTPEQRAQDEAIRANAENVKSDWRKAREAMHPRDVLRHHVTGAIERGEAEPIIEQPIGPRDDPDGLAAERGQRPHYDNEGHPINY